MFSFHHTGVITNDMNKVVLFYQALGHEKSETFIDMVQEVEIVFMEKKNEPRIEIIKPLSETSPAFAWVKRIQGGPYHTCYECLDITLGIEEMEKLGLSQVTEVESAIAFNGRSIVFMWNKNLGLIELLESGDA